MDDSDEPLTERAMQAIQRAAELAERRRCVQVVQRYYEKARELRNPDERLSLMLTLGMVRAEIRDGR